MRVRQNFGAGGAGLTPFGAVNSLAQALRDQIDDAVLLNGLTLTLPAAFTAIATANANAQTASYVEADVDSIGALANGIKAKLNALNSGAIVAADAADQTASYVEADVQTISTLLAEIVTKLNEAKENSVTSPFPLDVSATYTQLEVAQLATVANEAKAYINLRIAAGLASKT